MSSDVCFAVVGGNCQIKILNVTGLMLDLIAALPYHSHWVNF